MSTPRLSHINKAGLLSICMYRVGQKMTQLVFVSTSSNFHQIWQFFAHR